MSAPRTERPTTATVHGAAISGDGMSDGGRTCQIESACRSRRQENGSAAGAVVVVGDGAVEVVLVDDVVLLVEVDVEEVDVDAITVVVVVDAAEVDGAVRGTDVVDVVLLVGEAGWPVASGGPDVGEREVDDSHPVARTRRKPVSTNGVIRRPAGGRRHLTGAVCQPGFDGSPASCRAPTDQRGQSSASSNRMSSPNEPK
jgi:hypothetical protein